MTNLHVSANALQHRQSVSRSRSPCVIISHIVNIRVKMSVKAKIIIIKIFFDKKILSAIRDTRPVGYDSHRVVLRIYMGAMNRCERVSQLFTHDNSRSPRSVFDVKTIFH